ncbi:DnaD domain protein [Halarsenatibacter silvermanii]|uniref:Replication initiation and membrane attachment n=1 Tax=Halarsenatibacter silvermanii TaxID=321763 RepID=A0A1G9Q0Q5_9FIRM|nr:DnaD domain protein [Halarsenatibacter silvermanii]SDM04594.1 Replication initiation and membrane attachment [Halarsenatibacter silvermanii]
MSKTQNQKGNSALLSLETGSDTYKIGEEAIKAGFLARFSENSLSIFMYLAAAGAHKNPCTIRREKLCNLLPGDVSDLDSGIEKLEELGAISAEEKSHPRGTLLELKLYPEKLMPAETASTNPKRDKGSRSSSEDKIFERLLGYLSGTIDQPEDVRTEPEPELVSEVEKWQQDFPSELLKELLNRVEKWTDNPGNPSHRAHYYLRAIVEDWYEKEIFTLEDLQEYDRLYRETRELAMMYGFNSYHELNPIQLETLQGWLSGSQALSLEAALLAVEKAVKQKSDGRPSLDYIERNYIKPLKEAGARTREKAQKVLNDRSNQHIKKTRTDRETRREQNSGSTSASGQTWKDMLWQK